MYSVNQAAFLEALAQSLGVPEEAVSIAALRMQSARAAESHLRIARRLSAQVRQPRCSPRLDPCRSIDLQPLGA